MWLWCYEHACPWPLDSFFPRMMHKLCFAPRALRSGWFAHEVASTAACPKKAMFTPGGLIEISWPKFLQNTYHSHAWSCMRVCVKSWLWQMVANEIHCKRCQMQRWCRRSLGFQSTCAQIRDCMHGHAWFWNCCLSPSCMHPAWPKTWPKASTVTPAVHCKPPTRHAHTWNLTICSASGRYTWQCKKINLALHSFAGHLLYVGAVARQIAAGTCNYT